MHAGLVAANLPAIIHRLNARRCGTGWVARCPAHNDHQPSLSLAVRDGKVLVYCHAGCTQGEVIAALNACGSLQRERTETPQIAAAYDYADELGNQLYQVVRYLPKDFKQRRPNGCGGWVWKKGARQVLYRLPEVIYAPIVFVVEGERDVETIRKLGFVATTNAGGAKAAWLESYTETLRGRECILIPDNDRAGWDRVAKIARALLGKAARICILELGPEYKDISDWFAAGHRECELIALVEGVHAI